MIHLAIDAMGGSEAPQATVEGALKALEKYEDLSLTLHGDQDQIQASMGQSHDRLTICHTDQVFKETDDIFACIKEADPVPVIQAVKQVQAGKADGALSAGSTAAIFVSALHYLGVIDGLQRPAGLMHIPTFSKDNPSFVIIDVGTNADVKAQDLDNFAVLGTHYARLVQGKTQVKVGLLSNGTEDSKGNKIHKKAFPLLKANFEIDFVGNVEPHGLMRGAIDVLVADGFSGNVYLKQHEEMVAQYASMLETQVKGMNLAEEDRVLDLIRSSAKDMDTGKYGACLLAGIKKPVVVTHGRSTAQDIMTGIGQLRRAILNDYCQEAENYFKRID